MQASTDAGTDIAMLAAWDISLQKKPFPPEDMDRLEDLLPDDADEAKLLLIHTGADGGGPVHLFIDEPLPHHLLALSHSLEPDRLLHLPTGQLALDGAENYRDPSPQPAHIDAIPLPPGDYRVRVLVPKDPESFPILTAPSHLPSPPLLSPEDRAYFQQIERAHLILSALALPLLALFPILYWTAHLAWPMALGITLAPLLLYAVIAGARFDRDKSTPRYKEIRRTLALQARSTPTADPPTLILHLTRLESPDPSLTGGTLKLP